MNFCGPRKAIILPQVLIRSVLHNMTKFLQELDTILTLRVEVLEQAPQDFVLVLAFFQTRWVQYTDSAFYSVGIHLDPHIFQSRHEPIVLACLHTLRFAALAALVEKHR